MRGALYSGQDFSTRFHIAANPCIRCGVLVAAGSYCRAHQPDRFNRAKRGSGWQASRFRAKTLAVTAGRCAVCGSAEMVEAHHLGATDAEGGGGAVPALPPAGHDGGGEDRAVASAHGTTLPRTRLAVSRYLDDPEDSRRRDKRNRPEPTRQPRYGNRLYCMVWADHDLYKFGLSSARSARDTSAIRTIKKYFAAEEGFVLQSYEGWRTELPELDGYAWGDCQRFEMVVATAVKKRLRASAAVTLGLEWFTRKDLQDVSWKDDLTDATAEAVQFTGLKQPVEWTKYTS